MGHGRIGGDDQVEILHHRRRVHEWTGGFVDFGAEVDDSEVRVFGDLFGPWSFLQTDKTHAADLGQRGKLPQRDGSLPIEHEFRISLPADPDAKTVVRGEYLAPRCD